MAEEDAQSPFRQRALEYIATPKALDDIIQVTSPAAWILLAGFWLILAAILAWLFLGAIPIYAPAKGILIAEDQAILYVSVVKSHQLKVGMKVSLSPVTQLNHWQFQNFTGKIISIDYSPSEAESIFEKLHNQSLVKYFLVDMPVVALTVHINPSHHTKNTQLFPGILLKARIIIAKKTPLTLMMSQ